MKYIFNVETATITCYSNSWERALKMYEETLEEMYPQYLGLPYTVEKINLDKKPDDSVE